MKSSIWYVADEGKISHISQLEHTLNYGRWEEVQTFISEHGMHKSSRLFFQIAAQKRSNLKPKIKHYFSRYFRHAS